MEVIVKRSKRRKKTIQARMVAGKMEVLAPAHISESDLQGHIASLQARLEMRISPKDDDHLCQRAGQLNRNVLRGISDLELHSILDPPGEETRLLQLYYQDHSHKPEAGQSAPVGGGLCDCARAGSSPGAQSRQEIQVPGEEISAGGKGHRISDRHRDPAAGPGLISHFLQHLSIHVLLNPVLPMLSYRCHLIDPIPE